MITSSFGLREHCSKTKDCLLEIHKYFLEVLLGWMLNEEKDLEYVRKEEWLKMLSKTIPV